MADQCAGQKLRNFRWVKCQNAGKLEHDGKMWCGTHHPPSVKARKAARDAAYDAKVQREREAWLASAEASRRRTIEGMTDDELMAECLRRGLEVSR